MEAHFTTLKVTDTRLSLRTKMSMEPAFWDNIIREIPVCVEIEKNWLSIKDEFNSYMEHSHPFPTRGGGNTLASPKLKIKSNEKEEEEIDLYSGVWDVCFAGTRPSADSRQWGNTELLGGVVKWKTKKDLEAHLDYSSSYFKTFNSIVSEFADDGQCSGGMFSIVKPGTIINPHNGSDKIMRCHLCIVNDKQCKITVGNETKTWDEGKILAFKDGPPYKHSVIHEGTNDRVVLIFDFDLEYLRDTVGSRYL